MFLLKATALLILLPSFSAFALDWDLVPIIPKCDAGVFCAKSEIRRELENVGIVQRLDRLTEAAIAKQAKLYIAFMSFTEPEVFESFCRAGRSGVEIAGFFDSKAGPPSGLGWRLEQECQSGGNKNVRVFYMGMPKSGKSGWRLHHNKFVLADYGNGRSELALGSANLSTNGLSVNFENWNFITTDEKTHFVQDHLCAAEAMEKARAARDTEDDPKVFRRALDGCLSYRADDLLHADRLVSGQRTLALFAPDAKNRTFLFLESQMDNVQSDGRIRLATYFFMHRPLVEALQRAHDRGVKIELLLDDDTHSTGGSIPAQRKFYNEHLKPSVSKFTIRSFDTNEQIFQLQHNKFILLQGVGTSRATHLFGGAGQFTLSAFQNNYENFFYSTDQSIVGEYEALFEKLWRMGKPVRD